MVECPVCSAELLEMSMEQAEEHVNGCLDRSVLEEKKRIKKTSIKIISKQEPTMEIRGAKAVLEEIEQTEPDTEEIPQYDIPLEKASPQASYMSKHPLPSYKRMPHTTFTVDAFKYGKLDFCTGYFLTHFHSDHYGGLSRGFTGHIYCSRITANCVQYRIGVDPQFIHALPMNRRCNVQGVFVTFIDANHCPGAVIIVFEIPQANGGMARIVHTGDFRASPDHVKQILQILAVEHNQPVRPAMVLNKLNSYGSPPIDYLYLDTTYLQPTYAFPSQSQVVQAVAEFCFKVNSDKTYLPNLQTKSKQQKKPMQLTNWFKITSKAPTRTSKRRVLFVVGSYTIGKERLFIEIAQRLGARIYVAAAKRRMLECMGSRSLLQMLSDSMSAQVHVVEMSRVNMRGLTEYLEMAQKHAPFSSIVAFRPTGWSHAPGALYRQQPRGPDPPGSAVLQQLLAQNNQDPAQLIQHLAQISLLQSDSQFTIDSLKPRGASASVTIFPVPYSEHSSFAELGRFVCSLNTKHVVPTVSCDAANARWLQHWQNVNALFAQAAKSTQPELFSNAWIAFISNAK
ncbi:repair protein PSO2 SNM1 [Coemansia sp. RSA 989]|nr:repair protein PSO2 SNM1 [Coemansia sp. RSA 989]KAJ1869842.1 repair protein PSO2 SNM1 [Coemansia sp. RSA 990]KAJ2671314.1 repair protein PSO2 SNM1 [Coemansia sp. RSA 1085]